MYNVLIDAVKLSSMRRGAIQPQCDIMEGVHFVPALVNMIRQPSQTCSQFDGQFTILVQMDDVARSDLGANLELIESAVRTCEKAGLTASEARVVLPENRYLGLWRQLFQAVLTDVQLCLQEAVVIREATIVPNLAYEAQLLLAPGKTEPQAERTRIGLLMSACQIAEWCPYLDPILEELKAQFVSVDPIYIDTVNDDTLHLISSLAVLIAIRSPLDALSLFLAPTATLIEIAFDDELRLVSRYNARLAYHRIAYSDPQQTAREIARTIHEAIDPALAVALPISVLERRRRLAMDPSNPRLAIVVPYRDSSVNTTQGLGRQANLEQFATYMNQFLTRAGRQFEIVVIEQEPGVLFNKGALFNAAYQLLHRDFAYMALHDVDQLPINPANDYHIPDRPTHLCTASSQYGWKPAYATMVGGVLLLRTEQFERINGLSNRYWGWGMEDDDLYNRLTATFGNVEKLDPEIGRYQALEHERVQGLDETPLFAYNKRYLDYVLGNPSATRSDGLNTVRFHIVDITDSELGYTKYTIGLNLEWMPTSLDEVPQIDQWAS